MVILVINCYGRLFFLIILVFRVGLFFDNLIIFISIKVWIEKLIIMVVNIIVWGIGFE